MKQCIDKSSDIFRFYMSIYEYAKDQPHFRSKGKSYWLHTHSESTAAYNFIIARDHPQFKDIAEGLYYAGLLHDIGKYFFPYVELLDKVDATLDDIELIRTHAMYGGEVLETLLDCSVPFADIVKNVATFHHENWYGTGFPSGLTSDELPEYVWLTKLVDGFDFLTNSKGRPYVTNGFDEKAAKEHMKVIGPTKGFDPADFDPLVFSIFCAKKMRDPNRQIFTC